MDLMLLASVIKNIFDKKLQYFYLIMNNKLRFLKGDSIRVVTGIPLHESKFPQKFPRENYWQMCKLNCIKGKKIVRDFGNLI